MFRSRVGSRRSVGRARRGGPVRLRVFRRRTPRRGRRRCEGASLILHENQHHHHDDHADDGQSKADRALEVVLVAAGVVVALEDRLVVTIHGPDRMPNVLARTPVRSERNTVLEDVSVPPWTVAPVLTPQSPASASRPQRTSGTAGSGPRPSSGPSRHPRARRPRSTSPSRRGPGCGTVRSVWPAG